MSNTRIPSIDDFAEAEHLVLEDDTVQCPTIAAPVEIEETVSHEIHDETEINDRLRKRRTRVRLYDDGWAEIAMERRARRRLHRIDLRYLDPVPSIDRIYPARLLKVSAVLAGLTAIAAVPAWFGWLPAYTLPAAFGGLGLTVACLFFAWYLTNERIVFRTLHGRAVTIHFGAGLGTIRKFHRLVPKLTEAIANAAASVTEQTAVYLRSEMREHYRLRGEGVLTEQQCAESTGRILGRFDHKD